MSDDDRFYALLYEAPNHPAVPAVMPTVDDYVRSGRETVQAMYAIRGPLLASGVFEMGVENDHIFAEVHRVGQPGYIAIHDWSKSQVGALIAIVPIRGAGPVLGSHEKVRIDLFMLQAAVTMFKKQYDPPSPDQIDKLAAELERLVWPGGD